MAKEKCIIFDTNILMGLKSKLNEIKEALECKADFIIPEMVLQELEAHTYLVIKKDYEEVESKISKRHFKYTSNFQIEKFIQSEQEKVRKIFSDYCSNRILKISPDFFEMALKRSCFKIAPFRKADNSSDKGFKDTIIWLSILNDTIIDNYEEIILFSNDKIAFQDNIQELKKEFLEKKSKKIVVINDLDSLYDYFQEKNENDENKETNQKPLPRKNEFNYGNYEGVRKELDFTLTKLLFKKESDDYGNVRFFDTFVLHTLLSNEDIQAFFNILDGFISDHIFHNEVSVCELFASLSIPSTNYHNIKLNTLIKLNEIYSSIELNEKLKNSFFSRIRDAFNNKYKAEDEENPFASLDDDDPFADFNKSNEFPF